MQKLVHVAAHTGGWSSELQRESSSPVTLAHQRCAMERQELDLWQRMGRRRSVSRVESASGSGGFVFEAMLTRYRRGSPLAFSTGSNAISACLDRAM
uniref:Uncharacterized protein n=1 Tax=Knipowitschia caucasica TaxID=637954 RepID=A0AAV2LX80_KNICA